MLTMGYPWLCTHEGFFFFFFFFPLIQINSLYNIHFKSRLKNLILWHNHTKQEKWPYVITTGKKNIFHKLKIKKQNVTISTLHTFPIVDQFHWMHLEAHHSLAQENLSCSARRLVALATNIMGIFHTTLSLYLLIKKHYIPAKIAFY